MFIKSDDYYKEKILEELYLNDRITGQGTVDCEDYNGMGFQYLVQHLNVELGACCHSDECRWRDEGYLVHRTFCNGFIHESCSGIKKKTLKKKIKELKKSEGYKN